MFCRRCRNCRNCYRGKRVNEINFEELKQLAEKGSVLIDVRSPQEYNEGHLPGAINIPEYEIKSRIEKEMPKKNQQIILYCQYGGRSRDAYDAISKMGYNNIYTLEGGLEMI